MIEIERLKDEIESIIQVHSEEVGLLKSTISAKQVAINETESNLTMIGSYVDKLEERLASFAIARRDIEKREEKCAKIEQQATKLGEEKILLQSKVDSLLSEEDELKKLTEELQAERTALTKERDDVVRERDGLVSEVKGLRDVLVSTEDELGRFGHLLDDWKAKTEKLETTVEQQEEQLKMFATKESGLLADLQALAEARERVALLETEVAQLEGTLSDERHNRTVLESALEEATAAVATANAAAADSAAKAVAATEAATAAEEAAIAAKEVAAAKEAAAVAAAEEAAAAANEIAAAAAAKEAAASMVIKEAAAATSAPKATADTGTDTTTTTAMSVTDVVPVNGTEVDDKVVEPPADIQITILSSNTPDMENGTDSSDATAAVVSSTIHLLANDTSFVSTPKSNTSPRLEGTDPKLSEPDLPMPKKTPSKKQQVKKQPPNKQLAKKWKKGKTSTLKKKGPYPSRNVPFRSIRKAFARATGVRGVFTPPSHPNKNQGRLPPPKKPPVGKNQQAKKQQLNQQAKKQQQRKLPKHPAPKQPQRELPPRPKQPEATVSPPEQKPPKP